MYTKLITQISNTRPVLNKYNQIYQNFINQKFNISKLIWSSGYATWAKNMYIDGSLIYFIISEIKKQE